MIQAIFIKQFMKLAMPIVLEHLAPMRKYCFEDNELDESVKEMKKTLTSLEFKQNAMRDLFKDIQEQIEDVKKLAQVPKDFSREIDSKIKVVKNDMLQMKSSVTGFTDLIKKMKKITLLKSLFK